MARSRRAVRRRHPARDGDRRCRCLDGSTVGQSKRGYALLNSNGRGSWPKQWDYGYLHSDALRVSDAAFQAAITDVKGGMRNTLGTNVTLRVGDNGHSALLTARATREFGALQPTLTAAARAHPLVEIGGNGPGSGGNSSDKDLHRAEKLAVPVTLAVLLFAFGSVVAALVPVLLGLTAVVAAFGLLGPISHLFALDSSVKTIVLLIGMAVGVDYPLFDGLPRLHPQPDPRGR